jgi:hypothetical protein
MQVPKIVSVKVPQPDSHGAAATDSEEREYVQRRVVSISALGSIT